MRRASCIVQRYLQLYAIHAVQYNHSETCSYAWWGWLFVLPAVFLSTVAGWLFRVFCAPRAHFRVIFVSCEPNTTTARPFTQSAWAGLAASRPTSRLRVSDVVSVEYRHAIKEASDPVFWRASPSTLTQDFVRHQVSLQQRSNFHSSSVTAFIFTMVSGVNKTNLHPSGIT